MDNERSQFLVEPIGFPNAGEASWTPPRRRAFRRFRAASLDRWFALIRGASDAWALERARGVGFLLFTIALGLGAIGYFSLPFEPSWIAIAGALFLAGAGAALCPASWMRTLLVAVLAGAIGFTFAKIETWRHSTPIIGSSIAAQVTGRVVSVEKLGNGRNRLTLDVLETARPTLRYAPDRIRASAREIPEGILPGTVVRGVIRMMPPSGPVRPGGYDFAFESYFDGLGAVGFFLTPVTVLPETPQTDTLTGFLASVEALRMVIAGRIRAVLPDAEGEIAAALIAGVRAGIPEPVNEDLRQTGLAHILSISGLHMALVAATIMGTIRFCLHWAAPRLPIKKYAAAAALAGIAIYLLLSGSQVAAERSFLMLAVMLVAVLLDRKAINMRNLAIAALIILAVAPHEIIGPSFQMSFAATAALVAGYTAWSARRPSETAMPVERSGLGSRALGWIGKAIVAMTVTSLLAGAATTVFGIYHFQRVSPLSLVANLAVMPLVSILVMPFAVLSLIAMPLGLEAWPLRVMGLGLDWMLKLAHEIALRSPIDAVGAMPLAALAAFAVALAIMTSLTTRLALISLPILGLGFMLQADRDLPEMLVSEDARLVAVPTPDGRLAVNRSRPNGFTVENWLHAMGETDTVRPVKSTGDLGFFCQGDRCETSIGDARILWLGEKALLPGCDEAEIFVHDSATSPLRCPAPKLVLNKRDLALRGAASIDIGNCGAAVCSTATYAFQGPIRPWHDHRRFSREARGMEPYRRPERSVEPGETPNPPPTPQ